MCPIKQGALGFVLTCGLAGGAPAQAQRVGSSPRPCQPVTYHSVPQLRAQRLCANLGVRTHRTAAGSYLFLTPGGTNGSGAGIFKKNGTLVWWHAVPTPKDHDMTVVQYRGHRYLAVWTGAPSANYESGTVTLYNEHYQRAGSITAGGAFSSRGFDLHEFRVTPQGDALVGIYQPVTTSFHGQSVRVYQYVVQKVSLVHDSTGIHTGRVLFQWESLSEVPVSQSHLLPPAPPQVWDYFHGNSIAQDSDGNLIVSSRNTWGIYKISVRTGRIMWQVGAQGDHALSKPWCYQHDVTPLGQHRYSIFDDGGAGPGCEPGSSDHPARGMIVRVNPSPTPAGVSMVRAYGHRPPVLVGACGNTQVLDGGDVLIGWGNLPEVTEFGRSGKVLLDLSLSNWSYRAFQFPWVGLPLTRPAVAARGTGTGMEVWMSWNGSTEVRAWRVLSGPDASHLSPVGPPRPKRGFETQVSIAQSRAAVAVQALGSRGQVLATSKPVRTAGF
jgi:Arylsulfotransferase (ASST)